MEYLLSKGALYAIMNNEEINDPVMQVLGFDRVPTPDGANVQYRVLISDGQHFFDFAMLESRLHSMVLTRELAEFSVVLIKHYLFTRCIDSNEGTQQVMILIDLEVLLHGDIISSIIGDPNRIIYNSDNMVENELSSTVNVSLRTEIKNLLTKGAFIAILNNEEVNEPVFQIVGIRKITVEGENPCYRFLLSDGKNLNSLVMLTRDLNSMILSGDLNEFSIIQIKHYTIRKLTSRRKGKFMIIHDLVVLVPGHVASSIIGCPKPLGNSPCHMLVNGWSRTVDVTHISKRRSMRVKTEVE